MVQRRNELTSQIRQEPMEYRAEYDASNYVIYEGWADPGTATSEAKWVIQKHSYTSGNLVKTEWAGSADFDQVWDDRATLF